MDHNWGYVAGGYAIVAATVGSYSAWLWYRLRRARRSVVDEGD